MKKSGIAVHHQIQFCGISLVTNVREAMEFSYLLSVVAGSAAGGVEICAGDSSMSTCVARKRHATPNQHPPAAVSTATTEQADTIQKVRGFRA